MGNKGRWEYLRAIYERYRKAGRAAKKVILDEFCENTGYHRKYAIRLLSGPPPEKRRSRRERRRGVTYSQEMLAVLTAVWEAAGYPWSVRLKALLPLWLPWIRKRFRPRPETERQLLKISARQMDRRLKKQKTQRRRRLYRRTKPGYLLKQHIPVKTDRWDVHIPGFTEADLVAHSGNSASGEFAHTLTVTDMHTTWTESSAVLGRAEEPVQRALNAIATDLPFPLLGVELARKLGLSEKEQLAGFLNGLLQGRAQTAAEIAQAALLLCSDQSTAMVGQSINVDGGAAFF